MSVSGQGQGRNVGRESLSRKKSPGPATELVRDLGQGVSILWASPSPTTKCD